MTTTSTQEGKTELFWETAEWLADAALLGHTTGEVKVVPRCPTADDMWDLGKLCSSRMGLYQKVARTTRRHGRRLDARVDDPNRHFLLAGQQVSTWEEVLVLEAVVGSYFRLFAESFLRSSDLDIAEVAKAIWHESHLLIRFGQSRLARCISDGGAGLDAIQAAVDKLLPMAVELLDEVPADLDQRWAAVNLRQKSNAAVQTDYLEEMATYLTSADLDIPLSCVGAIPVAEVVWLGSDFASTRSGGALKDATFAFSEKSTGRRTFSGRSTEPSSAED